jgi:hypothetical protein
MLNLEKTQIGPFSGFKRPKKLRPVDLAILANFDFQFFIWRDGCSPYIS